MSRFKKILFGLIRRVWLFIVFGAAVSAAVDRPCARLIPQRWPMRTGAFVQAGIRASTIRRPDGRRADRAGAWLWRVVVFVAGQSRPIADAGYTVFAPDMRGFGLSDKGWDRSMSHERRPIG